MLNRQLSRALLGVALAGALLGSAPALGAAGGASATAPGDVLALRQTPHYYVGDEAGTIHLAADVPALSTHSVAWSTRKDVTVGDLRQYNLGDPWLSMMLVRIGTAIYLPQAQTDGGQPVLRLVGSIDDLALIGVNTENYGRIVLEQPAWEARYGLRVDDLRSADLSLDGQPRVGPPAPEAAVNPSQGSSEADTAPVAQLVPPGHAEAYPPPTGGPAAGTPAASAPEEDLARY